MTSRPVFSFIIPSFNRADIICEALESIRLEQEASDYLLEAWVIDDCSSDNTEHVVLQWCREEAIHWLHFERLEKKAGTGAARNRGLDKAKGDIVIFLDSDDQILPGSLSHIEMQFNNHPDIDLYFGAIVKKSGKQGELPPDHAQNSLLNFESFIKLRGVGEYLPICRRSFPQSIKDHHYVDYPLRFREDINGFESILWMRMLQQGARLWIDPRPVRLYDDLRRDRLCHPDNLVKDSKRLALGFLLLYREFGQAIEDQDGVYGASLLFRLVFYNKLANYWNPAMREQYIQPLLRAPIRVRILARIPNKALQLLYPFLNRFRKNRILNLFK